MAPVDPGQGGIVCRLYPEFDRDIAVAVQVCQEVDHVRRQAVGPRRYRDSTERGRAQYLRVRGVPGRLGFVTKELSEGGPIYDIGVHVLDLTLHLMGFPEPVSVSAGVYNKLASKRSKLMPFPPNKYTVPDDAAFALIRFEGGATVLLEASWALNLVSGAHNVILCGDKGGCQLEPTALVRERAGVLENVTNEIFQYPERAGHVEEVRRFVEAILKKKPSPVPGEEALITQRILDGIYKSGELQKEVEV